MSSTKGLHRDARAVSAIVLKQVFTHQASLSQLHQQTQSLSKQDRAFAQRLCFGTCRYYFSLDAILHSLLKKSFKAKDQDIHALLMTALYQMIHLNTPEHAAINSSVDACRLLGKQWACKLVNGVLRNFLRRKDELLKQQQDCDEHPQWLTQAIKQSWPEQATSILEANQQQAPICLRLNPSVSREEYQQQLKAVDIGSRLAEYSSQGIYLESSAIDISTLPLFDDGLVSVQDESAQLASLLLKPKDGERILDACAAPGGKSCHLLELGDIELTAVDNDEHRCQRIHENLTRLNQSAEVIPCDVSDLTAWWDEQAFDRILLDAPCSATGVIRRHPDIKLLRRETDIEVLAKTQLEILEAVWPTLKVGGQLLYATCSILAQENDATVGAFLSKHKNAKMIIIDQPWGQALQFGRQLLAKHDASDGFYYALVEKTA